MLAERHGSPNSHQMEAHSELHHHASAATVGNNADDNLHTFREALGISSEFCLFSSKLHGAKSLFEANGHTAIKKFPTFYVT